MSEHRTWPCSAPWASFYANTPVGDVYPCCWYREPLGNLNKQDALSIWRGEAWQRLRSDMAAGDFGKCGKNCPVLAARSDDTHYRLLESPVAASSGADAREANRVLAHEEYLRGEPHQISLPVNLHYYPTSACGIQCTMCDIWREQPKGESGILEHLQPFLDTAVTLESVGGEPMLSRKWRDFIESRGSEHPGLKLRMVTNGKFVTAKALEAFPEPDAWDWIGFSFDAVSAEALAGIRRGISSQELKDNFDALVSYSRDLFPITALVTVMRDNCGELEELARYFLERYRERPHVTVSFSPIHGQWGEQTLLTSVHIAAVRRFVERYSGEPRVRGVESLRFLTDRPADGMV
ncbi:MAG: radical SAM protein, partial [bacterium]